MTDLNWGLLQPTQPGINVSQPQAGQQAQASGMAGGSSLAPTPGIGIAQPQAQPAPDPLANSGGGSSGGGGGGLGGLLGGLGGLFKGLGGGGGGGCKGGSCGLGGALGFGHNPVSTANAALTQQMQQMPTHALANMVTPTSMQQAPGGNPSGVNSSPPPSMHPNSSPMPGVGVRAPSPQMQTPQSAPTPQMNIQSPQLQTQYGNVPISNMNGVQASAPTPGGAPQMSSPSMPQANMQSRQVPTQYGSTPNTNMAGVKASAPGSAQPPVSLAAPIPQANMQPQQLQTQYGNVPNRQATPAPNSGQAPQFSNIKNQSPYLSQTMQGIAGVESSHEQNPYSLVTPAGHGREALGKYQIMGDNLQSWSKEALGNSVNKQEFLQHPELQDKIAGYQINKYLQTHSPNDAASMWFTGRPLAQAGNARDSLGTTNSQYQAAFNKHYNTAQGVTPQTYAANNTYAQNPHSMFDKGVVTQGLNQDLNSKLPNIMQDLKDRGWDPTVASGVRSAKEQAKLVANGSSHTMHSAHLEGNAVDIVDKRYTWNDGKYGKQISAFSRDLDEIAAKYGLQTGSSWKSFGPNGDFAHLQEPGKGGISRQTVLAQNNNMGEGSNSGLYSPESKGILYQQLQNGQQPGQNPQQAQQQQGQQNQQQGSPFMNISASQGQPSMTPAISRNLIQEQRQQGRSKNSPTASGPINWGILSRQS